jgi:hypothetical protein
VIGSRRSFFWRKVSVVTFLRAAGALVGTGAGVDMVSSDRVGAVWCGRPLSCRDVYSFKIMPSRSRKADTRGTLIIPQNSFFAYNNFV